MTQPTASLPYRISITHAPTGATIEIDAERGDVHDALEQFARRGVNLKRAAAVLEDELGAPWGRVSELRDRAAELREHAAQLRGTGRDTERTTAERAARTGELEADGLADELRALLDLARNGAPA